MSVSFGVDGDQSDALKATRCSQRITVEWDTSKTLAVARTPNPSVLPFKAFDTVATGVRSRCIGVPLNSLNLLLQALQR